MNRKLLKIFIISLTLTLCGAIKCSNVAPDDVDITIYPDGFELTGLYDERLRQSFEIVVKNERGEPMNGIEITIQFTFAPDFTCPPSSFTCTIPPAILLDEDRNIKNSPFTAKTNKDGKYVVWVDYWHGAAWKGSLEVYSGTAYESADIEIKD